jgi:hypothetical protein
MIELKDKTRKEVQDLISRGGMLTYLPTGKQYLVLLTDKEFADANGDYYITTWLIKENREAGTHSDSVYSRRKKYVYTV